MYMWSWMYMGADVNMDVYGDVCVDVDVYG